MLRKRKTVRKLHIRNILRVESRLSLLLQIQHRHGILIIRFMIVVIIILIIIIVIIIIIISISICFSIVYSPAWHAAALSLPHTFTTWHCTQYIRYVAINQPGDFGVAVSWERFTALRYDNISSLEIAQVFSVVVPYRLRGILLLVS